MSPEIVFLCVWAWNISVAGVAPESWQPEGRDWVEGYRRVWALLNTEISFTAFAQQVTMEMEVYQHRASVTDGSDLQESRIATERQTNREKYKY